MMQLANSIKAKLIAGQYPEDAVGSKLVSSQALLAGRVVSLIFFLGLWVGDMATNFSRPGQTGMQILEYFAYFTHLNLIGLVLYFGVTLLVTRRALNRTMSPTSSLALCHSLLYSWNVTFHPIVTIVFWATLFEFFLLQSSDAGRFVSAAKHGVTWFAVLVDILLGNMSICTWALLPTILLVALYTAWAVVFQTMSGLWVYPWLRPTHELAPVMYPGVFVATILVFFAMQALHRVKHRALKDEKLSLPAQMQLKVDDEMGSELKVDPNHAPIER